MSWRVVEHITIYREAGWYGAHPQPSAHTR